MIEPFNAKIKSRNRVQPLSSLSQDPLFKMPSMTLGEKLLYMLLWEYDGNATGADSLIDRSSQGAAAEIAPNCMPHG